MIAYNPVESFLAFAKTMTTYQESQKIRVSYLHQAKEAGDLLRQSHADFKASGFCTANPYIVGDRKYTSFRQMLKDFSFVYTTLVGPIPEGLECFFTESQASKCMTLSKEWDTALEIVDFFHPKNAYRLSKTLEIISWYKQQKAENPDTDPTEFTCERYWEWLNGKREAARQAKAEKDKETHSAYQELQVRFTVLERQYKELAIENENLRSELQRLRTKAEPVLAGRRFTLPTL